MYSSIGSSSLQCAAVVEEAALAWLDLYYNFGSDEIENLVCGQTKKKKEVVVVVVEEVD